ncbi:L,D-transpeptidase family protein [Raineyella antarctica]|nr:L,D-transpeptidase family protein [Raineyella antarctica]
MTATPTMTATQAPAAAPVPAAASATSASTTSAAAPAPLALPAGEQAIADKYALSQGVLGAPTTAVACGLVDGGCYQHFQGGSIYWSPATGAHFTTGAIRAKWAATRWENGFLGYPTTDETCGLARGGCYQHFQHGSVHWSQATGAHFTTNAIRAKWAATRWENGFLGYPTTDETCGLARGGCYTSFQGGSIHWSAATGAHWTNGTVQSMWRQRGYENGSYGYPAGDPYSVSGKTSQRFEGGYLTTGVDTRCLTGRTMCASKNDRKLRWMINGQIVQTMDARFGCSATPTDNGSFKVYWKSYNHTSTLYNTWMPRAMFYNGGEAVHYSPDFASRGYAGCSHGCVNIRDWDGINWLYNQVQVGDKVVVYY